MKFINLIGGGNSSSAISDNPPVPSCAVRKSLELSDPTRGINFQLYPQKSIWNF